MNKEREKYKKIYNIDTDRYSIELSLGKYGFSTEDITDVICTHLHFDHVGGNTKIENGKISDGALILIAKAAEGSVRDSLSLLDRALVSQNIEEKEINETFIRKMLGLADRSKILSLLNFIFQGDQKKSISQLLPLPSSQTRGSVADIVAFATDKVRASTIV